MCRLVVSDANPNDRWYMQRSGVRIAHHQPARRRILFTALVLAATGARAQSIDVLTLRYRTADDVLPLLRPFVEPGGALTGQGNQLFIRASAANRRQIEQMLAQLDRAPKQLLISVRQDRASESAERRVGADGSVTITTRGFPGNSGASGTLTARDERSVRTRHAEQTIRVIEGGRATITMGAAVPFTFRRWLPQPGGGWVVTGDTVFYEAVTGFQVRPQVAGDLVTLEITPEESAPGGPGIERTRIATLVQVRVGEWATLGGADARSNSTQSGMLSSGNEVQTSQRGVWVKVEEVK